MSEVKVDVLICGSGSAGIMAATWMARFGLRCKILERMNGPLEIGQADGVQCRTVEIFQSFGVSEELLREAYHCLEVTFWNTNDKGDIARTGRTPDTPVGISHMPHLILNQARVNEILLELMNKWNGQTVDYGYDVTHVQCDSAQANDMNSYPVTVTASKNGKQEVFKAKYVFGSDGAHSVVRKSLGYKMVGDSTNKVWGVMDIHPRTNFPDIRKKCAIHSKNGNILIIPREGATMVRFYTELPPGKSAKEVTREDLHQAAQKVFQPYHLEFAETFWWSAYSVGQRRADYFTKDHRVFLGGDACHTHSPKAGQGMNCSLQDGYNFGWKLASVLKGISSPDLLRTYVLEREKTATDLINFDRYWTKLWTDHGDSRDGGKQEDFAEAFKKAGKYMAGVGVQYAESPLTAVATSKQDLATNLTVGMRFPSTEAVRMSDANYVQLQHVLVSDGRWRIIIFAGDIQKTAFNRKLHALGEYLSSPTGPVRRHTPASTDIDSFIDPVVVLTGQRTEVDHSWFHQYFWPATGKLQINDLHKIFFDDETYVGYGMIKTQVYKFYGVDPAKGAIAIVRPDQYVAKVLSLEDHAGIGEFFAGFALSRGAAGETKL